MNERLRAAELADFEAILNLNAAAVQVLSPLSEDRLRQLHQEAAVHLVLEREGEVVAFFLALRENANYDSVNYQWFASRYPSFLYIDRIVVSQSAQRLGAGTRFYNYALDIATRANIPLLACEFDIEPPNPQSERFHAGFGFREVGQQHIAATNKRVSLQILALTRP